MKQGLTPEPHCSSGSCNTSAYLSMRAAKLVITCISSKGVSPAQVLTPVSAAKVFVQHKFSHLHQQQRCLSSTSSHTCFRSKGVCPAQVLAPASAAKVFVQHKFSHLLQKQRCLSSTSSHTCISSKGVCAAQVPTPGFRKFLTQKVEILKPLPPPPPPHSIKTNKLE